MPTNVDYPLEANYLKNHHLILSPKRGKPRTVVTLTGSGYGLLPMVVRGYFYCLSKSETSVGCVGEPSQFLGTGAGDIPPGTTLTIPDTSAGAYHVVVYTELLSPNPTKTIVKTAHFTVT